MKIKFAVLVALLTLVGCAGSRARTDVLMPSIQMAWAQVQVEAVRGGLPQVTSDSFSQALENGDTTTVVVLWPTVKDAAAEDIGNRVDAGLISAGVALSLHERLKNIDDAIELLKQRPP